MSKELSINDMDFGDLVEIGSNEFSGMSDFTPQPEKPVETNVNKDNSDEDKSIPNVATEEDELDVLDILSKQGESDKDSEDDEEQEDEDKGKDPSSANETKDGDESSEPFALIFARYQLEKGNLSELDEEAFNKIIEEEGEDNALSYLFQNEVDLNKNFLKDQYDKYAKEYIEMRESGVSDPKAYQDLYALEALDKIKEDQLEDEDNSALREKIIAEHLKATTKFSDERISKLVKRSIDLGDDIEDAKEALSALKEVRQHNLTAAKEAEKQRQAEAKANYEKRLKQLKDTIYSTEEIFKGTKINKTTQSKLEELITKPVKQTESGQVLNGIWAKREENPVDFDIKLAYLLHTGIFDGKLDNLVNKAKSKANVDIKNALSKRGSDFISGNGKTVKPSINKNEKDPLASLKQIF